MTGRAPTPIAIAFNAGNGTYTLTEGALGATFGPSDRVASSTYAFQFAKDTASAKDRLTLYGNVAGGLTPNSAPIRLNYLSFGSWSHIDVATGDTRDTYLIFGYPTEAGNMPKRGSASYRTYVTNSVLGYDNTGGFVGKIGELEGTADFSVDFGAGTVATSLVLDAPDGGGNFGTFDGVGTIYAGNQFKGDFMSDLPSFESGSFAGGFFGPRAREMGYTFYIYRHVGGPGGASSRESWSWVTGTVVGTKN